MSECLCPNCSPSPARSYTPEWMLECHARYVLEKPRYERREYLEGIIASGRRGAEQAALALLKEMMRLAGEDCIPIRPGSKYDRARHAG